MVVGMTLHVKHSNRAAVAQARLSDDEFNAVYTAFVQDFPDLPDSYEHDLLDLTRTELALRRLMQAADRLEEGSQEWGRVQTAIRNDRDHVFQLTKRLHAASDSIVQEVEPEPDFLEQQLRDRGAL